MSTAASQATTRFEPSIPPDNGKKWLLFSNVHNAYWGPNKSGYTNDVDRAGRYTHTDAAKIVRANDIRGGLIGVKNAQAETMVPAPNNIAFFVDGIPKTAGSKRGFYVAKLKRVIITDDAGKPGKDWRTDVQNAAKEAYDGEPLLGALRLTIEFVLPRIQSHFKSSGSLKPTAPSRHTKKPDALKLARGIEDALTGIIWKDDAQISDEVLKKRYGSKPGARIIIEQVPEIEAAS